MKLIVLVAVVVAISTAIPAGMLLAGPSTVSTQVIEPKKQEAISEAALLPPREPAARNSIPEAVKVEPPREDIVMKPEEPVRVAQPPQQPEQIQAPQAGQEILRQGIPQNYVLKGALVDVWLALGNEGEGLERANLIDAQLTSLPRFRNALISINAITVQWLEECRRLFPEGANVGRCGFGRPVASLSLIKGELTEEELISLLPILNSEAPIDTPKYQGNIERAYDVVIKYGTARYIIRINTLWGPP